MSFGSAGSALGPGEAESCPCRSGATFAGCCGPLLRGEPAPSPERLMRSRYTAFAVGDAGHIERTWHPRSRPSSVELDSRTRWTGLEIVETATDGDRGTVRFRASWRHGGERGVLAERSRFARRGGRWLYLDGDTSDA